MDFSRFAVKSSTKIVRNEQRGAKSGSEKIGEPSPGSPSRTISISEAKLEVEFQRELNVAALESDGQDSATRLALDRLDRGHARALLNVEVAGIDVVVAVIEGVVPLRAELQVKPLGELERLGNHKVHVPIARTGVRIAVALRQTAEAVYAAAMIERRADRNGQGIARANGSARCRVNWKCQPVEQIRSHRRV